MIPARVKDMVEFSIDSLNTQIKEADRRARQYRDQAISQEIKVKGLQEELRELEEFLEEMECQK